MHTDLAFQSARAPGPRLPGVMQLPVRLRQQPLNWQYQAEESDRFVTNPARIELGASRRWRAASRRQLPSSFHPIQRMS